MTVASLSRLSKIAHLSKIMVRSCCLQSATAVTIVRTVPDFGLALLLCMTGVGMQGRSRYL